MVYYKYQVAESRKQVIELESKLNKAKKTLHRLKRLINAEDRIWHKNEQESKLEWIKKQMR